MLYPDELRALKWSGRRDLNPRHPAPKAGALPDCATPRYPSQGQSADNTRSYHEGQYPLAYNFYLLISLNSNLDLFQTFSQFIALCKHLSVCLSVITDSYLCTI